MTVEGASVPTVKRMLEWVYTNRVEGAFWGLVCCFVGDGCMLLSFPLSLSRAQQPTHHNLPPTKTDHQPPNNNHNKMYRACLVHGLEGTTFSPQYHPPTHTPKKTPPNKD